jgi:hypothetical protein
LSGVLDGGMVAMRIVRIVKVWGVVVCFNVDEVGRKA